MWEGGACGAKQPLNCTSGWDFNLLCQIVDKGLIIKIKERKNIFMNSINRFEPSVSDGTERYEFPSEIQRIITDLKDSLKLEQIKTNQDVIEFALYVLMKAKQRNIILSETDEQKQLEFKDLWK